jgi:hypothetical protein
MLTTTLKCYGLGTLSLALFATVSLADSPTERERRARAALALAAAVPQPVSTAPAPREKHEFPGYAEGYHLAMKRGEVFVVYVGCRGTHSITPIAGAVIAVQDSVPGYAARTIVVGYPVGNKMIEDARLTCEQAGEVNKAVEAAGKKIAQKQATPAKTTPQPLDWQIRAFPGLPVVERRPKQASGASSEAELTNCCPNGACPPRH